jgi:hypothetical protein
VILFRTATRVSHAAVGITAHEMQSMAIKDSSSTIATAGAYAPTDQPPFLKLLRSLDFQGDRRHASRFCAKRRRIVARLGDDAKARIRMR